MSHKPNTSFEMVVGPEQIDNLRNFFATATNIAKSQRTEFGA